MLNVAAGTNVYVSGTAPATYNEAGFEGINDWADIAELTEVGGFGATSNGITHIGLKDSRIRKLKGSYDNGQLTLNMALDEADQGQNRLQVASRLKKLYSFKIVMNEGDDGEVTFYTTGNVMSFVRNIGTVDTVITATCNVDLDGDIVKVETV